MRDAPRHRYALRRTIVQGNKKPQQSGSSAV
ncbi:hypothetical protein F4W70_15240 [Pseudomonas cannabina]|nr:hypothetical protein F4W70_15240 [Pseudomonas cannabina]